MYFKWLHTNSIDVNECESIPCHQSCTNTPGSYECSCYPGYSMVGDECQGT